MAYVFVIISVVLFALYPVAIAQVPEGAVSTPAFLFFVHAFGALILLAAVFSMVATRAGASALRVRRASLARGYSRRSVLFGVANAVLNNLSYGCVFYAIQSGAVLEAAIFYELWATMFLLLSMWLRQGGPGDFSSKQGWWSTAVFFVLGLVGVVCVASSDALVVDAVSGAPATRPDAIMAAVASPIFMAASFIFGTGNSRMIADRLRAADASDPSINFTAAVMSSMMLRVFSLTLLSAVILLGGFGEEVAAGASLLGSELFWPLAFCGVIVGFGGSFGTIANNLSDTSNVNLLYYFVPFLAVMFLALAGLTDNVSATVYFGAILVLSANYVLTASYRHSFAFKSAILTLCLAAGLVFFAPPLGVAPQVEYVAIPIGLFGILAAFLIDRLARDAADPAEAARDLRSDQLLGQNVFVLWILGFGSLTALFAFRAEATISYDFLSVVVAVAIVYLSLLPIDTALPAPPADDPSAGLERLLFVLVVSAAFIFALFALLFIGLLERLPAGP